MQAGNNTAHGAVHVDLATIHAQARVIVALGGADARRFLQGLVSADVDALAAGEAVAATLLTVKGKIVSEAIVLLGADGGLSLAIPAELAPQVVDDLDRHIIMDDVTLSQADGVTCALVWPEVPVAGPVACYRTRHPLPGVLVIGASEAVRGALAEIPSATAEDFTRARVRLGAPAWGHEIRPDHFPPEVGFIDAVSFTKGCFRGQEPLARIHARGQVNRVLVRVRADSAPIEAAPLAAEGRADAGLWTTWVADDEAAGVIGLAIVHRSLATPGARLQAGAIALEVTSGPIGDDPGVEGKARAPATVPLGRRS